VTNSAGFLEGRVLEEPESPLAGGIESRKSPVCIVIST
jgi:hypothetical protein